MSKLLEAAREIQERNDRAMAALQREGRAADGRVRARLDGHRRLLSLELDPGLVDPARIGELEGWIQAAINQATEAMNAELKSRLGAAAASLPRWLR